MTIIDKEWEENIQKVKKSTRRKKLLMIFIVFLFLVIGVVYIFFRHQIFDKKLTSEDIKTLQENFNRTILKSMGSSEKASLDSLQEEKMHNDCIRNAISNGEIMTTYMQKCANESFKRQQEKYQNNQ